MTITDYILFPIYVLLFNVFFSIRRKRIKDPLLQKYHKQSFWIKVACAFLFAHFCYYISSGDSITLYYPEGVNFFKLILKDITNIKWIFTEGKNIDENIMADPGEFPYFSSESNFWVVRFVTFFSFFCFGKYLILSLFFSMLSFTGTWRLFKFFYEQYPHLHKKLAISIIYLPTFIFWSSGVLKDPICIAMMGWLTYSVYCILYKREKIILNTIIAIVSGYLLASVKVYILVSYLPFLLLFLLLRNVRLIKNMLVKTLIGILTLCISVVGLYFVANRLQEELGLFAIDKIADSVHSQQKNFIAMADLAESSFSLGVEFDGSTSSMLKMAPAAVVATLYRPFLWESKKISTLLSSLESLTMMLFTLYVLLRVGPITFFSSLFKDPMILFCFFFSILFALFVGATTLNFGTLVRYKIPCMPFYLIALFLILEISDKKKGNRPNKTEVA